MKEYLRKFYWLIMLLFFPVAVTFDLAFSKCITGRWVSIKQSVPAVWNEWYDLFKGY